MTDFYPLCSVRRLEEHVKEEKNVQAKRGPAITFRNFWHWKHIVGISEVVAFSVIGHADVSHFFLLKNRNTRSNSAATVLLTTIF